MGRIVGLDTPPVPTALDLLVSPGLVSTAGVDEVVGCRMGLKIPPVPSKLVTGDTMPLLPNRLLTGDKIGWRMPPVPVVDEALGAGVVLDSGVAGVG